MDLRYNLQKKDSKELKMKRKKEIIVFLTLFVLLLLQGCSKTINTWNNTVPTEYLEVFGKDDLVLKLKEQKVKFKCVDLVYSTSGNTKKCYVEKKLADNVDGWSSRLYKTSKMALLDTGENIIIFGVLVLCSMGGDCQNLDIDSFKD